MDFNSGSLTMNIHDRYMGFTETVGSISNSNGDLLFYSNGIYVANALDDTMQNGTGLNPSAYTSSIIATHGLAIPQGNLVIPFPGDSTIKSHINYGIIQKHRDISSVIVVVCFMKEVILGGIAGKRDDQIPLRNG